MREKHRLLSPWLVALAVGLLGTWLFHLTQFSNFDLFPGDRGDARFVAYCVEHWYQALRGEATLLSPAIFYPVKGTLGYSDILLAHAFPYSMLRVNGLGIFPALEVTIIVFNFLNYLVCFFLLYKTLRLRLIAACAGAYFFAFNSPKLAQLGHLQLQCLFFLPLIAIFIIVFMQQAATINQKKAGLLLSLAALCFNLQLMTTFYLGWYLALWALFFFLSVLAFSRTRALLFSLLIKFRPAIIASGVVFLLGFIPFLLIYLPVVETTGWRPYEEINSMTPTGWAFLAMGDGNYIWGGLSAFIRERHLPDTWGELQLGIGLAASLAWLAVTAFSITLIKKYAGRQTASHDADLDVSEPEQTYNFLLVCAILATNAFLLVGLKYWSDASPWYYVYQYFPGGQSLRAVARYMIFLALPMAIAFACVLHYVMQKIAAHKNKQRRTALTVLIIALIAFGAFEQAGDYRSFSMRGERYYLEQIAAKLPNDCSAFYVAAGTRAFHNSHEYQIDASLVSVIRHVPTLNGYSGKFPPAWSLFDVKALDYEGNVKQWIQLHNVRGKVCRLELDPNLNVHSLTLANIIGDTKSFVRQQYSDFFNREPEDVEMKEWTKVLAACAPFELSCDRIAVSTKLFRSPEFWERGYFVLRLYQVAHGRMPNYGEFMMDMQHLRGVVPPAQEDQNKIVLIENFIGRNEFKAAYEELSHADYVRKLMHSAKVALPYEEALISDLESGRKSRAEVLKAVAESQQVSNKFFNEGLIVLHYFGYLRRDPDAGGLKAWLKQLDANADARSLADGFLDSPEYRKRFPFQ